MIRSMTGYGTAQAPLPDGRIIRAEIRTVNHRHLSVSAGLPRGWEGLRAGVVEMVREVLGRGSVSLSVTCESPGRSDGGTPVLDLERARRYVELLRRAGAELDVDDRLDLGTLAALPGVLGAEVSPGEGEEAEEDGGEASREAGLMACVEAALRGVVGMREAEGRRLEGVLRGAVGRIGEETDAIEALAPQRLLRERDRLRERVRALAGDVETDEERLAREIAYLAERWDIAEEVARLRSHTALFVETLDAAAGAGTAKAAKVGKRLGFVVQEMHREANTVGAKANDAAISAGAVAIKEELERLREQLENVE